MSLEVRSLSPEVLRAHMPAILDIAADVPGEYWTESHFLDRRPQKWLLSCAAWRDDNPVGYVIASRRSPKTVHIHHFMIAASWRRRGLARRLLQALTDRAEVLGAESISLKVHEGNDAGRTAYRSMGFGEVCIEGEYLVLARSLGPTPRHR